MDLDQENAGVAYDAKPENARWVQSEDGATYQVTFDPELLVAREILVEPYSAPFLVPSPFIQMSGKFTDYRRFQREAMLRRDWLEHHRPIFERLSVHYANSNWALFDKDFLILSRELVSTGRLDRFESLCQLRQRILRWFTFEDDDVVGRAKQRMALARSLHPDLVDTDLAGMLLSTGRLAEYWRQVEDVTRQFFATFSLLSPILQPIYWTTAPKDLNDYVICIKGFAQLKDLYIAAFETLARSSIVAFGLEGVIVHGALANPTKKGDSISLLAFEKLTTANKKDHLGRLAAIEDMFAPFMSTQLRNGIGHNSAHYDAASDMVVYSRVESGNLVSEQIGYTDFCHETMTLISRLFATAEYLWSTIRLVDGRLT